MSVFTLAVMSFIPNNQLTEQWHNYFDKSFEIRNTIDGINENLSGAHYLRYLINSGEENGIHDPAYLNTIENFATWLRQQDKIAYVSTLSDISKRLNKTLHEDKPEWYVVKTHGYLC